MALEIAGGLLVRCCRPATESILPLLQPARALQSRDPRSRAKVRPWCPLALPRPPLASVERKRCVDQLDPSLLDPDTLCRAHKRPRATSTRPVAFTFVQADHGGAGTSSGRSSSAESHRQAPRACRQPHRCRRGARSSSSFPHLVPSSSRLTQLPPPRRSSSVRQTPSKSSSKTLSMLAQRASASRSKTAASSSSRSRTTAAASACVHIPVSTSCPRPSPSWSTG